VEEKIIQVPGRPAGSGRGNRNKKEEFYDKKRRK